MKSRAPAPVAQALALALTLALTLALAAGAAPALAGSGPGLLWMRTYGGAGPDMILDVTAASDGGLVAAGASGAAGGDVPANAGGGDAWVFKIDRDGRLEWSVTFGGPGDDLAKSVAQTADGGYIVAGEELVREKGSFATISRAYQAWAAKLDPSGKVRWRRLYGGPTADSADSVFERRDGRYLMFGTADSPESGKGCGGASPRPMNPLWTAVLDRWGGSVRSVCRKAPGLTDRLRAAAAPGGGAVVAGSGNDWEGNGAWAGFAGPDGALNGAWAFADAEDLFVSAVASGEDGGLVAALCGAGAPRDAGPGTRLRGLGPDGAPGMLAPAAAPERAPGCLRSLVGHRAGFFSTLDVPAGSPAPSDACAAPGCRDRGSRTEIYAVMTDFRGAELWRLALGGAPCAFSAAVAAVPGGGLYAAGHAGAGTGLAGGPAGAVAAPPCGSGGNAWVARIAPPGAP